MNSQEIVKTIQEEGLEEILIDDFDTFLDFVERKVPDIETLKKELKIIKNAQKTKNNVSKIIEDEN